MLSIMKEDYEGRRIDIWETSRGFLCFFHATVDHALDHRRNGCDGMLLNLKYLLLWPDWEGEEAVAAVFSLMSR